MSLRMVQGEARRRRQHAWLLLTVCAATTAWLARGSFSASGPILFVVGVFLFIYLPGALTLELFRIPRPRSIALTLACGLPSGLVIYSVAAPMLPARGYLVLASVVAFAVALTRPQWISPDPVRVSRGAQASMLVIALLSLGLLSETSYRSIEKRSDGSLGYTHSLDYENIKIGGSDAFFHAGVTAALAQSSGASVNPFLVGAPLAYHAGMDIIASTFDRELDVPSVDLAARLLPTLFVLTLSALVFELAAAFGLPIAYSLLAVVLTFASDSRLLFYLIPVDAAWSTRYWLGYFTSYPATTYYWTNPHLPALVVLLAGLVILQTAREDVRGRVLAGLLLGATAFFKVFLALHVAVALSLLVACRFLRLRGSGRYDWVPVVATAGILQLVIAIGAGLYGGSEVSIGWTYLGPVKGAFRLAGLAPLAEVIDAARDEPGWLVSIQAIASLGFYLVMLLGVRLITVVASLKTVGQKPKDPVAWFVASFFLVGLLPALAVAIRVSGLNNSFWFTNQSLFIGALLVAMTLARVSRPATRRMLVAFTLVVALLPTWRDVRFRGRQAQAHWSASELEAALAIDELANADAIVLHPVNRETPSPASHLAGRASVLTYWQGYPFSFAPAQEVQQRATDIANFFKTDDPATAQAILTKYNATWVYAPATHPLRGTVAQSLEEVFRNDGVTLYRSRFGR